MLSANRVGSDEAAFDELMRIPAHELAILERARLRLVGVAKQVVRLSLLLGHERPLHTGREASTTAPPQPGRLHHVDDVVGAHAQRLFERLVAATLDVGVDMALLGVAEILAEDSHLAVRHVGVGHYWSAPDWPFKCSTIFATSTGVTFS